jgi:hypothetical protein
VGKGVKEIAKGIEEGSWKGSWRNAKDIEV